MADDAGKPDSRPQESVDAPSDNRDAQPRKEFNWSRFNNLAVKEAAGDLLLFLNDDTSVIAPEHCVRRRAESDDIERTHGTGLAMQTMPKYLELDMVAGHRGVVP